MPGLARVFDPVIVGSRRWPAKQVIRSRPSSEASRPRRRRAAASARAMALVSTRLEGVEEVRETKIVVGDAVLPRKSHAHIDEAGHPGFQPPTTAARRRVQTRPTASAVLGGASGIRHIPNRVTPWPPLAAGCRASYAYAAEVRDNSRASMWYAPCPLRSLLATCSMAWTYRISHMRSRSDRRWVRDSAACPAARVGGHNGSISDIPDAAVHGIRTDWPGRSTQPSAD